MSNLQMHLAVHAQPPSLPHRKSSDVVTQQLWIGGAVDRATRTMIESPRRWLTIIESTAVLPPAQLSSETLLSWDLEQINPGDRPSPENAGGVMLTSMDIDPAVEDEFADWYNTEHIPILSKLPGMLAARRFRARSGSPRYVALYHVTDIAIYAKPSWYTANETPWMLRMRRFQRNRTYFTFRSSNEASP